MIAIDLDGTLLRSDGSPCMQGAEAIAEAVEKGVKVVLASGRAPRGISRIYEALGLDTHVIAHNGAVIIDVVNSKVIHHQRMPGARARRVIETIREVAGHLKIGVEILDRLFTEDSTRRAARQMVGAGAGGSDAFEQGAGDVADADAVGAFAPILKHDVTKIMVAGEAHTLFDVQSRLSELLADEVAFSCSHMKLLQVVDKKADKAYAIKRVAKLYGIEKGEIMCIGDAPNDSMMIREAGLACAMKNGWSEVKRAAHFVVPTNDDAGVAHAIRKYAL